jgi:hypothetical protein
MVSSSSVRCSPSTALRSNRYRQHDELVGPFATRLQRRIAEEWVSINRDASTGLILLRWARSHPVLADADRVGTLVDRLDAADHETKDAILIALIELFGHRQQLAGRVALQAMLPKLTSFALRDSVTGHLAGSADDRLQGVIGEFWQVLGQYPVERRPARVAANLAMDTFAALKAGAASAEIPLEPANLGRIGGALPALGPRPDEPALRLGAGTGSEINADIDPETAADITLDDLLGWAVRRGVLNRTDAALLAEVYAARPGARGSYRDVAEAYRALAEHTGTNPATLRQRAHRARTRLTLAARAALAAG